MWERTLQDLVRGLRANKKDEAKFIAKAVDEIRQEIKGDDMELKAAAVLKLTYLDMLGYDMSWAAFHVVEVMSSAKVHLKSVGYLAAAQSFEQDTDVLMLTTNLLKKDLSSTPADIAVTLNGLSHIVTPELGRDLTPELVAMLNHSRPHIRKRAVLALYKVMMKYPDAVRHGRTRLEEKLEDSDQAVVAATVNVLCELAQKNPQDYLSLAPQLFHLMTSSTNNWMLIKIIKLFGSLSPYEPRLVKKLQPPITDLISTTPAISLLYECVHTCIIGGMLQGPQGDSLAKLCVSKLAAFIEDADQNLKYIALLAMAKIVPTHPYLVADYQDTILSSVNDQDISIRMRALDLVSAMVNRSNLQSIVQQLLSHLVKDTSAPGPSAAQSLIQSTTAATSPTKAVISASQAPGYRLILAQRILAMGSFNTYQNVGNFEWYISVLVDLANVANVNVGAEIRDQLVDIVGRVRGARPYAIKVMYSLITDPSLVQNASEEGSCPEILWAAAWICGEYCEELVDPQKLIPYLMDEETSKLSPDILAMYIQATMKIFGYWTSDLGQRWEDGNLTEVKDLVDVIMTRLRQLSGSQDIEVQERAANVLQLFTFISADLNSYQPKSMQPSLLPTPSGFEEQVDSAPEVDFPKSLYLIQPLLDSYELNPVATTAQASVPIPEGLDLDAWIVPPPPVNTSTDDVHTEKNKKKSSKGKEAVTSGKKKKKKTKDIEDSVQESLAPIEVEETPEERALREQRKAERLAQLRDDPYYIIDDQPPPPARAEEDVDSIPIVRLEAMPEIKDSRFPVLRSQAFSSSASFEIERDGEMPQGAVLKSSRSTPDPPSTSKSSTPSQSSAPSRLTSFVPYEVPEEPTDSPAPEPIKVVRSKKKASSKKKRTADS
ncbi:hypothetical protein CVT24_005300 [Panaeolus cyanescens]|uniref:AP-3 complex subunit delta n=1 Tax=Panaeolus cyanescens TaxID=181874 RepID=A0A409Y8X8_9AGAR|nr:hypothetical protein CVT24_005300 [Panaeolus cyanescens]